MEQIIKDPISVLTGNVSEDAILQDVKKIIDPITKDNSLLDEIHIEGLKPSQVWGQVKLVVDGVNDNMLEGKLEELSEKYGLNEEDEESDINDAQESSDKDEQDTKTDEEEDVESKDEDLGSDAEYYNAEGDEEINEEENSENENDNKNEDEDEVDFKPEKDEFGLNEGVFSMDEYRKQVQALDENGDLNKEGDEEDVDLFADIQDDSDDEMYYYDDFFKPVVDRRDWRPSSKRSGRQQDQKRVRFADKNDEKHDGELDDKDYEDAVAEMNADFTEKKGVDDEEDDGQEEGDGVEGKDKELSTFEKQQQKLKEEISALEDEAVADKKWTMQGEVSAHQREKDALLDEDLEFERTARPVPVVTQETTDELDDIIRERIKNEQFDEVPKKVIGQMAEYKPSGQAEVSQEKSSKSLAEEYEDEYMSKQSDAAIEELKKAHAEITVLFDSVTHDLDTLCSAHFRPKPAEKLLDIKVETSAVSMEDAQPLTMSSASTLAPQEVYKLKNKAGKNEVQLRSGVIMSKDELSRADKSRLRRAKKRKIRNRMKENAEKKRRVLVKKA